MRVCTRVRVCFDKERKKSPEVSTEHGPFPASWQLTHKEQREGVRRQLWAELFLGLDVWGPQPRNEVSYGVQVDEKVPGSGAVQEVVRDLHLR